MQYLLLTIGYHLSFIKFSYFLHMTIATWFNHSVHALYYLCSVHHRDSGIIHEVDQVEMYERDCTHNAFMFTL